MSRCIHQCGPGAQLCARPPFERCDGNPDCPFYEEWDGKYTLDGCIRVMGKIFAPNGIPMYPPLSRHPYRERQRRGT